MHPEKHCSLPGIESSPRTASPVRPTQSKNFEVRIHQLPRTCRDERSRQTGREDPQPTRNKGVRPDGRIERWDRSKLMLAIYAHKMRPPRLIKRNEKKLPYFIASKDSSTLPSVSYLRPTLQLALPVFPQTSSPTPTPSKRQTVNPRITQSPLTISVMVMVKVRA